MGNAAAADLVSPGESPIVDVGTTATAVARALAQRRNLADITVFAKSLTNIKLPEATIKSRMVKAASDLGVGTIVAK